MCTSSSIRRRSLLSLLNLGDLTSCDYPACSVRCCSMAMLDIVGVYESDKQWRLKGVPNISLGSVHVDLGICLFLSVKILDLLASDLPLWQL